MESKSATWRWLIFIGLLVSQVLLLGWGAWRHSPTGDEIAYLPSGISHWQFGRFELYCANPPLVRMVAALPVLLVEHQTDWTGFREDVASRCEFGVGRDFIEANGNRSFWLFTLARWACIPFVLVGGVVCYCWASELFDTKAGLMALALWTFSPTVLGNGQIITPDAATASLGLAAAYCLWRWVRAPTWRSAITAGLMLGLATLAKTNWIVLFALWPLLWFVCRWQTVRHQGWRSSAREAAQFAVIFFVGLYTINATYAFGGSFQRLGDFRFVSRTFRGEDGLNGPAAPIDKANRFAGTWLGSIRVPLPELFVSGIDVQKQAVERNRVAYLRGRWRTGGWWYYYLYAAAVKVPLGVWLLLSLALLMAHLDPSYRLPWRDGLLLLAPAIVTLVFISSQSGINRHFRYAMPILPFVFVGASRVALAVELKQSRVCIVAAMALAWTVGSSLWVYPHSLSYFNELAGGPRNGPKHLLGSNVDWGQDLLFLKRWVDEHPEARPLALAYANPRLDPTVMGIECRAVSIAPEPGWFALSVNELYGQSGEYAFFLDWEPTAMVGYSTYIYHVTLDEANSARQRYGLSEFAPSGAAK